jgi:hypothetical protein
MVERDSPDAGSLFCPEIATAVSLDGRRRALNLRSKKFFQSVLGWMSAAALATTLSFTSVPRAQADDDHAKCQRRIEKAESRLDEAVRHHGERSPEAESRRRDLNAEREHCWSTYRGYWSGSDHRWHTERDWDHDRDDRDRDHDDHH